MLANTAVEFGNGNVEIERILSRHYKRQMKAFEGALGRAVAKKEVYPDLPVKKVAASMTAIFYGLSALARAGAPLSMIRLAAQSAIDQMK